MVDRLWCEAGHSPYLIPTLRISGAVPPLLHALHRGNSTFIYSPVNGSENIPSISCNSNTACRQVVTFPLFSSFHMRSLKKLQHFKRLSLLYSDKRIRRLSAGNAEGRLRSLPCRTAFHPQLHNDLEINFNQNSLLSNRCTDI